MKRDYSISREIALSSRDVSENAWVITPKGHLDSSSVQEFKDSLGRFIDEKTAAGHLLVDMAEVPYISSMGLGALIELQKKAREKGFSFALYDPQIPVRRVFEISKLDFLLVNLQNTTHPSFASYFAVEEPQRQKRRQDWAAELEKKSSEIAKRKKE